MCGDEKEAFWKAVQCTVEKDVIRTDRCHPYFFGEGNPNIDILKYVLSFLTPWFYVHYLPLCVNLINGPLQYHV